MTDLVARLRSTDVATWTAPDILMRDAADRIEKLEALLTETPPAVITFNGTRAGTGIMRGHQMIAFSINNGVEQTVSLVGGTLTIKMPRIDALTPQDIHGPSQEGLSTTQESHHGENQEGR